MSKRILLTGGCGFIGHHFVEHLLKNTDWHIVILDRLSYSSNGYERLRDIEAYREERITLLASDFAELLAEGVKKEIGLVNYIVHMGAETHVDNSITDPVSFVKANVLGTAHMLNFARELPDLEKFVLFSTDEVFGPATDNHNFKEGERHNPSNPYAATKAGAEDLAIAYANTYKLPIVITNTMNVFGERQHPEKFIPLVIKACLEGGHVGIHSHPDKTRAGSRFYIHARNVADALLFVLQESKELVNCQEVVAGKFNIVGEQEIDNLALAEMISSIIQEDFPALYKAPTLEMVNFHESRPGHDLRYALDGSKLESMGYEYPKNLKESLRKTIHWTIEHKEKWLYGN